MSRRNPIDGIGLGYWILFGGTCVLGGFLVALAVARDSSPQACPDPAAARPVVLPATTFTVTKTEIVGDPWKPAALECGTMRASGVVPWMPGAHWTSGCVALIVGATQDCMRQNGCPRKSYTEPVSECQKGCFAMFEVMREGYGVSR